MDPHGPYDARPPYDEWAALGESGTDALEFNPLFDPERIKQPTKWGREALYDGEIRRNDAALEGFVDRLRRADLFDDTALVLLSDHGEHFGEHGVWDHRPPGTRQVTHVPLMLVYPKRFRGGQHFDQAVQLMDVMPTILELAGIQPGEIVMQGDSLVGLIEAPDSIYWRDRVVVSEEPMALDRAHPGDNKGLRVFGSFFYRDLHLIASRAFWPRRKIIPESLRLRVYAYRDDPQELDRLLRYWPDLWLRYQYTAGMNKLRETNQETWSRFTSDGHGQNVRYDPGVLDRLRALGYIQ